MEYKKSLTGRMKYFFKSNKINQKIKQEIEKESLKEEFSQTINPIENEIDLEPTNAYMENRDIYTIEDLVVIYSMLEKGKRTYQNLVQDINAMKLRLENFKRKVKNAENYMHEVDENKKSFWNFLKFTKKDEILALEKGNENIVSNENNIKKVFDLEMDFESLGVQMDKIQRKKLSKEELESIFVVNSKLIGIINNLRKGKMDEDKIKFNLNYLKEEFNKNRLSLEEENFDIFGNVLDDNRKLKYIGSRSHRENQRSKYRILNINKNIDEFDFTEKLGSTINYLEGATAKITSKFDMPLYKLVDITRKVEENNFSVMNIDVEDEFQIYEDKGEGALNLLKFNFKEGMPLLYYTNIVYYDNVNQTLPEGMDLSKQVLIDCSKFNFRLVKQTKFRTNDYFRESNNLIRPKSKDIFVYEYDLEMKN